MGLVSNGGVAGAGWGWDGDGGGHTLSRQAPPVVSKGWVESGEFNKRATSRQPGGGGGLSRKGVLSRLLYQPFYKIVRIVFFVFF